MRIYSFTQLYNYSKCRWLWDLQYRQQIRPVRANARMNLGSLVHVGLAEVLRGEMLKTAKDAIHAWANENSSSFSMVDGSIEALTLDAFDIVVRTVKSLALGREWRTVSFKGEPCVEREFSVDLDQGDKFGIRVDWVALHVPTGTVWVVDHKTRTSMQPTPDMDWSLQLAIYQYVLSQNELQTTGSIVHQIRSVVPAVPKQNLNGTMSRADILTDWSTYKNALVRAGLDPAQYTDMEQKLEGKVFFSMARTFRSPRLLQDLWNETILTSISEIRDAYQRYENGQPAPRNMSTVNCQLCSCAPMCHTALVRGDTQVLIDQGMFERTNQPEPIQKASEEVNADA